MLSFRQSQLCQGGFDSSVAIDGLEQEVRLSAEHDMDEAKVGFGEIQLFFASLLHLQVF